MLFVSLYYPFLIAPSVFSNVYLSSVLWSMLCVSVLSILDCPFCFLWSMLFVSLYYPFLIALLFSLTFICPVSCDQCYLCLCIIHSWLPLLFSNVYLSSVVWSMMFVSLYYPFLIAPSVFSNVYLSSVLWSMLFVSLYYPFLIALLFSLTFICPVSCDQCCLCLCIIHSWLPLLFSNVYLSSVVWSMMFVSLYYPFLIAPSVFSNVYLSSVLWSMLFVSLYYPFLIAPSVSCDQCCVCLCIIHSWLPLLFLVINVVCVSVLSIPDCPFRFLWSMLFVSLYYPFLIAPSVSCDQCCLCLCIIHSWLPLLFLVINVVCVSVLSIPDCPFCFL